MRTQDSASISKQYLEAFQKYGDDPRTLWPGDRRTIRYHELLKYADWGDGLLDIGCGFGDINQYIMDCQGEPGKTYRYLGVDFLPEFLEIGRKKYGSENIQFLQGNVDEAGVYEKIRQWAPAWAIASGIFNSPNAGRQECYDFMLGTMARCFELCKNGISFNFKNDNDDYKKEGVAYHSPMKVLEWAYTLTRNVILDNSCMPFETTITLFKDDSFNETMCFNRFTEAHKTEFETGLFRAIKRK